MYICDHWSPNTYSVISRSQLCRVICLILCFFFITGAVLQYIRQWCICIDFMFFILLQNILEM